MKILGIKNPEDLAKAPSSAQIPVLAPIGGEVVERLVSPGQVVQAGQTQAFTISDMSTVWVLANVYQADLALRADRRRRGGADRRVSRHVPRENLLCFAGARSQHPHTAGAHRRGQSRRKAEARYVLHGRRSRRACSTTRSPCPMRPCCATTTISPLSTSLTGDNQFGRRDVEIGQAQNGQTQIVKGIAAGRQSRRQRQPVSAVRQFAAALRRTGPMIHRIVQFALRQQP